MAVQNYSKYKVFKKTIIVLEILQHGVKNK